jgi:cysteine desulfurase
MTGKQAEIARNGERVRFLRDHLEARITSEISNVTVTHGKASRLPNTSSLVIPGVDGETLLMSLDVKGYAVSTGAACSSGSPEPSPVLLSLGLSRDEAQSSLRVSLGWTTTQEEIEAFVETLKGVVERLRELKSNFSEKGARS